MAVKIKNSIGPALSEKSDPLPQAPVVKATRQSTRRNEVKDSKGMED